MAALAQAVAKQQERLRASRDAGATSLRAAATQAVTNARERLTDIENGAAKTLEEYDSRRERLTKYAHAFREQSIAATEHAVITQCRNIAEAYADARRPLHDLQARGDRATLGGVASAIARLVTAVEAVRKAANEGKLRCEEDDDESGENAKSLNHLLISLETRTVDVVIKARAAFVNILDNEFRTFGWPMQIPVPEKDSKLISTINFFVGQLDALQEAAEKSDLISPRTQWQRTLSDSWAIACILRAPLARFKYHFLESFRADLADGSGVNGTSEQPRPDNDPQQTTSRFDRPEWAADFAVKRIQETTPFLREIAMKGPLSAELKFMKGFCRVFADKIAYDCELAMRSSKNDSDADALISHAADTARQFDVQLRSSALEGQKLQNGVTNNDPFPSALSLLSANTVFFTAWACSELRLAETQVGKRLDKILGGEDSDSGSQAIGVPNGSSRDVTPELDIEAECNEILQMVGEAGNGCRQLNTPVLVQNFLRLTELPLLQNLRARLREPLDECEWIPSTEKDVFVCSRAAWCAQMLSELLEDRIFEPFYAKIEEEQGSPLYADDIEKMKSFAERACSAVADSIAENFEESVKESYQQQVRFGELSSQDAAVVLAHDLSEPLCKPMTRLAESLRALVRGAANRKVASLMWRSVASRLDGFFFEDVVMQAFAGGMRDNVTAASPKNAYLKPRTAAKMARQVAFDAAALVSVFDTVSTAPRNFLPKCAEAAPLIRVAAARVMRPNIAPKQGQEEAIKAVLAIAGEVGETEESDARVALCEVFEVTAIEPREALELFAITGLRKAIPLS